MKIKLLSCAAAICFAASPIAIAQPDLGPMWDDAVQSAEADAREPVEWDLTRLYPTVEDWDAARLDLLEQIAPVAALSDGFEPSAASIADLYDQTSAIAREGLRISTYAFLDSDTNLRDGEKLARRGQAQSMFAAYGEAVAWINPMIQEVGADQVEAWIAAEPRLEKHAFGLRETLRMKPHTLSAEGEAIMAAASVALGGAQRIYTQLKNSDIPWPTVTLSTGEELRLDAAGYVKGRAAENREDRVKVFNAFFETYQQFESSLGEALGSHVQRQVFNASQRNYDSALEAALADDNIPREVYDTLLSEVNASLPTLHRYFELRARILGIEEFAFHDIYPNLVETDQVFDLEKSAQIAASASEPFGTDYVKSLCLAMSDGWTHAYPSQGKRSGAYMSGSVYDLGPFVLLNHQDTYNSASTFVHEWGHAMHTILANDAQPFETARYSIFIAETAAITKEVLAQEKLLAAAETDAERLFFLGYALEQMRGTYFRQTQFAEFEAAIHAAVENGESLTGARMTEIYTDIFNRYYGVEEGVTIVPEAYNLEWAYIPHFFYDFYVYQYSTSLAAAVFFADKIQAGDEESIALYLEMLEAGGSAHPYDLKVKAGLDMASPAPYRAVEDRMNRIMDEIEAILDRQDRGIAAPARQVAQLSNPCGAGDS
ncbi:MAG: oligoendopeptidase F family protein [Henriciella sp.]|nr:oligoendopeptidase F family protein [Henriciella sp.]